MSPFDTREQYQAHQLSTIWTPALASRYMRDLEAIAKRAHECCMAHSAHSDCTVKDLTSWEKFPQESKDTIIELVQANIRTPYTGGVSEGKESHDRWVKALIENGWTYKDGPKDHQAKTHPLLIDYDKLKEADKAKDYIFQAVIRQGIWELAERVLILFKTELGNTIN